MPAKNNHEESAKGKHEHPLRQEISEKDREIAESAREEAMDDIDQDPDLSVHSPNDDLDEGESARLGEDTSPII
jgi:hypothetical protein